VAKLKQVQVVLAVSDYVPVPAKAFEQISVVKEIVSITHDKHQNNIR
jgi:hypothetical protein